MGIIFRFLISWVLAVNLAFAAGYGGPEWDSYRLVEPLRTLMPIKVTTKAGLELIGHSIGDQTRFAKHSADMWEFFSDDKILATWGGINAKTDTPEDFHASLRRWKERATNNLLSWRLYYNGEQLISMAGSYLPIDNQSQYDGGAEIVCNTHPEYWRQGAARAVVSSYIGADMMRSPFIYVWSSAKPGNITSSEGVLKGGFIPWAVDLTDPLLPSSMNRPGRQFFRMERAKVEEVAQYPFEWVEK